ncbi:cellulose binding domain-containing protein [Verrucosispora sioxanthis]|nr:cellulose binding domain-containing protein [Verrucosispora sioxanthis]
MSKQLCSDTAPYTAYYPDRTRIYQFGWNGKGYRHLDIGGTPIADWAQNEQRDYTGGHGMDATRTDSRPSLFLIRASGTVPSPTKSPTTAPPADGLTARFVKTSSWNGGYRADYVITNNGSTKTTSWVLEFDLPSGTTITKSWSATHTWNGQHHRFTNLSYNGDIAPGASEKLGFNASGTGLPLDNSHHVTIDGMHVHHIDEEAVHFRRSSADGIIRDSVITDTGLVQQGYGEAVYIGSAKSNFGCHGNSGGMDRSDRVQVLDNQIGPNVTAEHVDVKEGTADGVIRGNRFDGQGISGANSADSWVDVKGSGYLIEDNTGTFRTPGTFANGYETHNLLDGYGCGNTWRDNTSDLGGVGRYAIRITSTSKCSSNPNVVHSSNTVTGAVDGLTNIPTTP